MLSMLLACAHPGPAPAPPADPASEAAAIVAWLSDDAREGRSVGSPGFDAASAWVAERFAGLGLTPGGDAGTWYQEFQVTTGVALGDGPNRLAVDGAELALRQDFLPASHSSQGAFDGKAAFVGYGISAPDLGYDDWAGIDVAGRVVIMMRYEPRERDALSPFAGDKPSHHSELRLKAHLARERGAIAVLVVDPPDGRAEPALALGGRGPESEAGLPCLSISRATADRLLGAGGLAAAHAAIDADLKPRSRLLDGQLSGGVSLARTRSPTRNVVGYLPGRGALADEVVVVGAHLDHLGHGGAGSGSLRPDSTDVHNGADDNASGVAGMLLAARRLAAAPPAGDRRAIWFVAFSGEEVGLRGSAWFVKHGPVKSEQIVAMLNLDMVGNLQGDVVTVLGTETAEEWPAILAEASAATGLGVNGRGDGYGPSDQTSFYAAGAPVLHMFTGAHPRYHTPDDDAEAVNAPGVARVAALVAEATARAAEGPRPTWKKPSAVASMTGDSRGRGASLGTVPDYSASEEGGGVLLTGVRAASPAEAAGLRQGDRLVGLGGRAVDNLYDFTYALQAFAPGDTVEVVWLREGQELRARVTLASRSAAASTHAPTGQSTAPALEPAGKATPELIREGERHFGSLTRLTFGGENAEAYWSPDGKRLSVQITDAAGGCDQIWTLGADGGDRRRISEGGKTTCAWYLDADTLLYSSTHLAGLVCPAPPDKSQGYVWAVDDAYDLFAVDLAADGSPRRDTLRRLTETAGYDAEATACADGSRVVFTSARDGDLDIYELTVATGKVRRLTDTPGYDGGAVYNRDCSRIVWRASRPEGPALDDFRGLLGRALVRPSKLELYVMDADGGNVRALTGNGAANFGPAFAPRGKDGKERVIFASNLADPKGRNFDLYLVGMDGGEPVRLTTEESFDGFPLFSPDGTRLAFASNRGGEKPGDTNIFVATWKEP